MPFYVYMLRCADGSYYVGHTENLEARLASHQQGLVGGYTLSRRPVSLVWQEDVPTRAEAIEAERRLKRWSRAKKEALADGGWEAVHALGSSARGEGLPPASGELPSSVRGEPPSPVRGEPPSPVRGEPPPPVRGERSRTTPPTSM